MHIRSNNYTDAVEFVREIVRSVLWSIEYHTRGMVKEGKKLTIAEEMMERFGLDGDAERADRDEYGEAIVENVTQFVCAIFDDQTCSVENHETQLKTSYTELAMVKIMLQRGNYTEINIEEIQKQVIADYDKPRKG